MEETALAVLEPKDALAINRAPDMVLDEARNAAQALTKVIEGKKKKVQFNGQTYLQFEDWQTLGRFYGVTAIVKTSRYIEFGEGEDKIKGFEAVAEALLVGTNQVISSAEAMCLNDEKNWMIKPMFQLKSMAQTRACAKALRNVLAWVVVLAGYSPTPAEEMTGDEGEKFVRSPERKSRPAEMAMVESPSSEELNGPLLDAPPSKPAGNVISEKQQKRLYAISKANGWDAEQVKAVLGRYGFAHSTEITKDQYESICTELER